MLVEIFLIFAVIFESFGQSYDTIVETSYGQVGGVMKVSSSGRNYLSFSGIPFAKPPVGDLRFANPVKPEPWDGVLDGTQSASRCIQRNYLMFINPPVEGSEDCLYLNVYIPESFTGDETRLPVIVSIPWGNFMTGGGDEGYFDPSYLMDYDVILVSFNYRLGVFGFLTTLDDEAPGNYGLKDQILALQWVQENIEYFGGLKDQVTIMGQSAGAASVNYLMLSPAAKGLFSGAISQSGNAQAIWAAPQNAVQPSATQTQAQLVNCSDATANSKSLIDCLRKVPAEDIAKSQDAFKSFYQYPLSSFSIVTEQQTDRNPNPFLTKTPLEYVTSGDFQKVPWLTGSVKNEGLVFVSGLLTPDQERNDLNNSFSILIPSFLSLSLITNDTAKLFENITDVYLDGKPFIVASDEWEQGLVDLFSDRYNTYSLYKAASLQLQQGHDSIYFYSFEYSGEYTYSGVWGNESKVYNPNWTICHCDDLLYQFKSPDLFENQLTSESDRELSDILLSLWVNFATYGEPNPLENIVLEDVEWEPLRLNEDNTFGFEDLFLLNITGSYETGPSFSFEQDSRTQRLAYWAALD